MELTELLAKLLGLDVKYMTVIFRPNPRMMWAGTPEPCAVCRLTAIHNVNEEANRRFTEKVFKFMNDKLNLPGNRMYILFYSPAANHVGFTGRLFSDLKL
ncbi:macrophage migration inhibitory factor-like [Pollicipes pollicipes]|uniref:macrophage migration inhibitory factor-like n=1 Tax=Pollicipes pollicipes TaxID=41117 RepID=UPI001884E190|nr:macrophage migration inhibitory factor-like [Pollicipes pollicipes]